MKLVTVMRNSGSIKQLVKAAAIRGNRRGFHSALVARAESFFKPVIVNDLRLGSLSVSALTLTKCDDIAGGKS